MASRRGLAGMAAAVVVLAAVGLLVRLWHVASEPLWLDEAYSAYAADHGFAFLWQVVPRYETHPPVYYSLLRLWTLAFGDGLAALRAPGLIAGIATPPVLAWAARDAGRLLGWTPGRRRMLTLAVFAFACVSIPLTEMSRQVRPYPLLILAYAGEVALLIRLLACAADERPLGRGLLIGFFLLMEALLWLHNMGPLYAVALTLALGAAVVRPGLPRRDWAWIAAGYLLVAACYLPGLAILLDQAPTWIRSTWLRFTVDATLAERLAALYATTDWPALAGLALLALALATLSRERNGRRLAATLMVLAFAPTMLSIGLSLTIAPVFIARTMSAVAAPTLVLLGIGAMAGGNRRRHLIALGFSFMLWLNMLAVDVGMRQAGPSEDWYGTANWLAARVRPGDRVVAYPNEGALPLGYALRDKRLAIPVRPIPTPVPSFDQGPGAWYPTGSRGVVSLSRERLRAIADDPALAGTPTIWLLRLAPAAYDVGNVALREFLRSRHVVGRWHVQQIEIVGLARGPRSRPAPARNPR